MAKMATSPVVLKMGSSMPENKRYTNRLINEKSPYLLQHAHNPVDWYTWGEEAFEASKRQDKPIFLSVGYATCHWCHVMEKESFEDPEVAKLLNNTFINIKVDREELPEVDGLYMEFAQSMMAGSAGWPLNVILTPDLQPFFAATYLPPESRHGLMGLKDLVKRIRDVWSGEEREQVMTQAEKIVDIFEESVHTKGDEMPEKEMVEDAADLLFKMADPIYGGMKGSPKFPIGYQSNFMLRYSATMDDGRAIFFVEKTLDMMHRGGIYDHLGGGFSRYSVDEQWLVPHFEKMLYDNALLAFSYLEAWQATKKPLYRQVCEEVLNYVLREMTHPEGGFYSAQDADSEGHEGLFYTWTYKEVENILGKEQSKLFCEFYDVTPDGNFEGRNILHARFALDDFASSHQYDPKDLALLFSEQRQLLWKARELRKRPFKDDKILSSWNGLMIFSMIEAGAAFQDPRYINAAVKALDFIKGHLWQENRLLRRWRDGEALYNAGLDEYAFIIKASLSLFESGQGTKWLQWALNLSKILKQEFKVKDGAFYQTDGSDPHLIMRKLQFSDGAEPSGVAVHTENLLRLFQLTGNEDFLFQAEDVLKAVKKYLDTYAPGYTYHIMNLNRYYDHKAPTLVVALNKEREYENVIKSLIYKNFIPHKAVVIKSIEDAELNVLADFVEKLTPIEGKTTLYLCYEGVCTKPLNHIEEIKEAIQKL